MRKRFKAVWLILAITVLYYFVPLTVQAAAPDVPGGAAPVLSTCEAARPEQAPADSVRARMKQLAGWGMLSGRCRWLAVPVLLLAVFAVAGLIGMTVVRKRP